jgi:hypothetical protein
VKGKTARSAYSPTWLAVGNESARVCLAGAASWPLLAKGRDDIAGDPSVAQPANSNTAPIAPAAIKRVKQRRFTAFVCKMFPPVTQDGIWTTTV